MSDDPIIRLNAALEGRYRVERELGEAGLFFPEKRSSSGATTPFATAGIPAHTLCSYNLHDQCHTPPKWRW